MSSKDAATPDSWLAAQPPDRAAALGHVRDLVNANLPDGYEERMSGSMIAWVLPLETYPNTYNGQPLMFAALAAQKNHNALYLMSAYASEERTRRLQEGYKAAGKKLDMGKSCLRFKKAEEIADEPLAEAIRSATVERYVADCEAAWSGKARDR